MNFQRLYRDDNSLAGGISAEEFGRLHPFLITPRESIRELRESTLTFINRYFYGNEGKHFMSMHVGLFVNDVALHSTSDLYLDTVCQYAYCHTLCFPGGDCFFAPLHQVPLGQFVSAA